MALRRLVSDLYSGGDKRALAALLGLALILLVSACGQVQLSAEDTRELTFQAAISDIEAVTGFDIADAYEPAELSAGSLLLEGRVYGSANDGVVARLAAYDDGTGQLAVAWQVTAIDKDAGQATIIDSLGESQTLSVLDFRRQAIGTESVVVTPNADDPGSGDGYNCVKYCVLAERTYLVYTYSFWVEAVKYLTVAACGAAGGTVGGPVGGQAGLVVCTILVEEIWKERELVSWKCLQEDWACSTSPHTAPKVPRTKYKDILIPGN